MLFIDSGIYGDGDLYESDANQSLGYSAWAESAGSYVAVRLHYTSQVVPGNIESFRVLRVSFDCSLNRPAANAYEAFIDRVDAADQISVILRRSGDEFVVDNLSLFLKMKRSKGKDV